MEQTEDVIEAGPQLYAEDPTFWAMLIVLGIRQNAKLQDRKAFARQPKYVLVECKRWRVTARVELAELPCSNQSPSEED